ncbi:nicotinamide riboside transporter PnuC [Phaeodactylibacter luteus]|uniref:Nicotinamide riboside transporter PnuC n=1 Tax=Phaeodactylibacter luteus TaxID=1564516 RepID=A0A5C6S0X1_9BACT|nr:nicotinamide riboside transporter PnuC [Phaeodactylibacter luteus]TXB67649.1 nicotinamide mononucleotide transporter [Phaeodactylibacter luteus]
MESFVDKIAMEAGSLSWVDWAASITAIVYVVLAARSNIWCWFWGIISCSLWAYASFVFYGLYLDALLQVFYVGMGFWGIYTWRSAGAQEGIVPVSRLGWQQHAWYLLGGGLATLAFGYFFGAYTPAAATYWDAGTTTFSVLATFMLARRRLDNWAYWVAIDAVYAGLYFSRGAYLFALLMAAYTLIAGKAWASWKKEWQNAQFY